MHFDVKEITSLKLEPDEKYVNNVNLREQGFIDQQRQTQGLTHETEQTKKANADQGKINRMLRRKDMEKNSRSHPWLPS